MADGLDLASTIGTWVGAGIGIIALVGIVGPALIWYASTRNRQKTLNLIGTETNEYVSQGVHLGPNIWLGRRVRAPMLKDLSSLHALDSLSMPNFDKVKPASTETSWVIFGSLLEAYGIRFDRGDELVIQDRKALLPVHPSWIFMIGVLGRYSDPKTPSTGSMIRRPRFGLSRSRASRHGSSSHHPVLQPIERNPAERGAEMRILGRSRAVSHEDAERSIHDTSFQGNVFELFGTTGAIGIQQRNPLSNEAPSWTVAYEPNIPHENHAEVMAPRDICLFTFGFVKTPQCHYINMTGVYETYVVPDEWEDDDLVESGRTRPRLTSENNNPPGPYRPSRRHADPVAHVYRLGMIELDQDVYDLGRSFLGSQEEISVFGLMRENPQNAVEILKPLVSRSILPAESEWVRIEAPYDKYYSRAKLSEFYVERIAAQRLAHGLLSFPWHPAGYMLDRHDSYAIAPGMAIFEAAAIRLDNFIIHLNNSISKLIPDRQRNANLAGALKIFGAKSAPGMGPRSYRAALKLEAALAELGNPGDRSYIDYVVGILAITNREFRDLVYDSLRSLREATSSTAVELEMPSATLKVPKAFGVMAHFFTDWQEMFPDQERHHEIINVSYTDVVVATVRALVRCEMLRLCPDARPLIDAVTEVGDLFYMV